MAEYVHCGFVRSYILSATLQENSSKVYDWLVENISTSLTMKLHDEKKKVKMKFKDYVAHIQKRKISGNYRKTLIAAFSHEKWIRLTEEEQLMHTLGNCQACLHHHRSDWDLFPKSGRPTKRTRLPLSDITNTVMDSTSPPVSSSVTKSSFELKCAPSLSGTTNQLTVPSSPSSTMPLLEELLSSTAAPNIRTVSFDTALSIDTPSNFTSPTSTFESGSSTTLAALERSPSKTFEAKSHNTLSVSNAQTPSFNSSSTSSTSPSVMFRNRSSNTLSGFDPAIYSTPISDELVPSTNIASGNPNPDATPSIRKGIRRVEKKYGKELLMSACSLFATKYPDAPPLPEVLGTTRGTGLSVKPTATENKRKDRSMKRKIRDSQREGFQKESRDVNTLLESRQSISGYGITRAGNYMEDIDHAAERAAKKKRKVKPSESHIGKVFDRVGVLDYVEKLPSNSKLQLTDIVRKFDIPDKGNKGNVILKDFLKDSKVDLDRFSNEWTEHIRRKYDKMPGGEISVAVPQPPIKIAEQLKKDIESGKVRIGELIAPKKITKLSLDKDGNIVTTITTIHGRKIPMREIRDSLNKKFSKLKIFKDETSITRYLMVWSDHSCILNHGYLLLTVKSIYTQHTFLTDAEYFKRYSKRIDIQAVVESPEVYIFGTCKDTILDKLSYVTERMKDIQELVPTQIDDKVITDELRMFQGDHPELQFEIGNSQGGKYPCHCGIRHEDIRDIELTRRAEVMQLEQRRQILLQGPAGRKGVARPFLNMRKKELAMEIEQRNYDRQLPIKPTVEQMNNVLKDNLKGIDRAPALCYQNENKTAAELGLASYEVSPSEPLHDLKGHISNLWASLQSPNILQREHKEFLGEILEACYGSKSAVKGSDYRLSVIVVHANFQNPKPDLPSIPQKILDLVETLMIICQLAYAPAQVRSQRKVLLLYNATFIHHCLIRQIFGRGFCCAKVTNNVFYGAYFHSIHSHFPQMYRYIAISSIDAECEERLFASLKQISIRTGSRQLEHTRDNGIVRLQSEQKQKQKKLDAKGGSYRKKWKSKISKFGYALGSIDNTIIPRDLCNRKELQAHLESISDFMLAGEGVWWHQDENGITFHDGDSMPENRPEGPILMDVATHNLCDVYNHVTNAWEKCIDEDIPLPITMIDVYDKSGKFLYQKRFENVKENGTAEEDLDFVPKNPEEKEDNDFDLVQESTRLFPTMPKRSYPYTNKNDDSRLEMFQLYDETFETIQSDIGKQIGRIIGSSSLLIQYDKNLRLFDTFKDKKHFQTSENLKFKLANTIRSLYIEIKQWFEEWKKSFYISNAKEPDELDISHDEQASIIYYKMSVIEITLRGWKIPYT